MSIYLLQCKGSSFATGLEVQDKRKRVLVISTGSKSVDAILGGNYAFVFPSLRLNNRVHLRRYRITVHQRG